MLLDGEILSFGLALLMLIDRTDQDGLERDK
jgi:hypothetical protein